MKTQLSDMLREAAPRPVLGPDPESLWRRGRRENKVRTGIAAAIVATVAAVGVLSVWMDLFSDTVRRPSTAGSTGIDSEGETMAFAVAISDGAVAEPTIVAIDVDSGESFDVAVEFAPSDAQPPALAVGEDLVYQGPDGVYAISRGSGATPRPLGSAAYFVPAVEEDRVWLTRLDEGSSGDGALEEVWEVIVEDGTVMQQVALAPGEFRNLLGEVTTGLVFEDAQSLRIWDPDGGETILELSNAHPLALRGDLIAWCPPNDCTGAITVTDAQGNERATLPSPDGYRLTGESGTSFSPDGRLLVTTVTDGRADRRLVVFDLGRASAEVLPEALGAGPTAWSGDSAVLYGVQGSRLIAYNTESGQTTTITDRLPSSVFGVSISDP